LLIPSLLALLMLTAGVSSSCKKDSTESEADEAAEAASPSAAEPTPAETPQPAVSFAGNWVNKNPATSGITRLRITQDGTEVKVHAFGKCSPADCDWGQETGGIIDNSAVLTWDQSFVIRKMTLTRRGGELRCVLESVYTGNRPRQRSEEVFVKQS
jgi:hypothetical protein